jgi:glucose dehydrogenase
VFLQTTSSAASRYNRYDFGRGLSRLTVNGTLIALNAKTGAVRMSYPLVPRDYHDRDVSAAPAVFTTRGGVKIAAEAIKNGHVYGIETATGRHLWSVSTTTLENVQAPLSTSSSTRFCPGTQGGSEWNGASYSPQTNLVYVGAVDWCTTVKLASADAIKALKSGSQRRSGRGNCQLCDAIRGAAHCRRGRHDLSDLANSKGQRANSRLWTQVTEMFGATRWRHVFSRMR